MNRFMAVALCALVLAGCQDNAQRARDYKTCRDAGMGIKQVGELGRIVCVVPAAINPTCNCEDAVRGALAEIKSREAAQ